MNLEGVVVDSAKEGMTAMKTETLIAQGEARDPQEEGLKIKEMMTVALQVMEVGQKE